MSDNKKRLRKFITVVTAATGVAYLVVRILAKKKKSTTIFEDDPSQKNPFEGKKVVLIEDENDKENADGAKGHLEAVGEC